MPFIEILSAVGLYIWDAFKLWLHTIFVAPFSNLDMFWILAPIYLGWVFADFFQEKRGTSLGNAISNGVIALWAGVDWLRNTFRLVQADPKISWTFYMGHFLLCLFVFAYGLWIIFEGIQGKILTKYIGRIREVTYVLILFTPVVYGVTELTFSLIFATVIFFPLFYYAVEVLDFMIPDPKSIAEDTGATLTGSNKSESKSSFDSSSNSDPFSSSTNTSNSKNKDPFASSNNNPFGGKDDFKF